MNLKRDKYTASFTPSGLANSSNTYMTDSKPYHIFTTSSRYYYVNLYEHQKSL